MKPRGNWQQTTLGEALPIRYGKARTDKAGVIREDSPVYGSSGVIGKFNRALTSGPALIIGRKGTVGAAHYSAEPSWPIDTVYFAEGSDGKDLRFFKYLLDHLQLGRMDRSTAVPGLSRDDYNAKEIAIPDFDEQQRIVAEIEKQFTRLGAGVGSLQRVQAALKRYRASALKAACEGRLVPTEAELARKENRSYETGEQLLQRILKERRDKWNSKGKYKEPAAPDLWQLPSLPEDWTWATAEQLSDASRAITYGVIKLGAQVDDGVPILRSSDVRHLRLDLQGVKRISPSIADGFKRTFLRGNEVLVTVRGTLGGVAVVPLDCKDFNISREVAMIALVELQLAKFVAIMIGSSLIQHWLRRRTKGIAYTGINIETLKQLPIPLPPLAEQQRMVEEAERQMSVLNNVEGQIMIIGRRSAHLRSAILGSAFCQKSDLS